MTMERHGVKWGAVMNGCSWLAGKAISHERMKCWVRGSPVI